jgi:hypothetical protein
MRLLKLKQKEAYGMTRRLTDGTVITHPDYHGNGGTGSSREHSMTQYEVYLVEEMKVVIHNGSSIMDTSSENAVWIRTYTSATTTKALAEDLVVELKEAARKSPTFLAFVKEHFDEEEERWGTFEEHFASEFDDLHTYKITPIRLDEPEGQPAKDIHAGTYL